MLKKVAVAAALLALLLSVIVARKPIRTARRLLGRASPILAPVHAAPQAQRNEELSPIRKYHPVRQPPRLDAWRIIGPGGGGAFYNASISPHDPNLVFVTTDMSQCFVSENGGLTWRQFNLRMTCRFYFDPKRPNVVYVTAGEAGLWRSGDRGRRWSLVYPNPAAKPGVIYMDDGSEAHIYNYPGYPTAITAFAIDPDDPDTLYAIVPDQLRFSTDAGKSWKILASKVGGSRLYVDPSSPRGNRTLITAAGETTGVWDGTAFSGPLKVPNSTWVYGWAFGVRKSGKPVLYSANDFMVRDGVVKGGGLLATEDGGRTWRSLNEGFLKHIAPGTYPEFTALGTSRNHPETLYVSLYHWRLPNDPKPYFGVMKTTDGGATWSVVTKESGVTAENMHDSWIGYRFGPDWGDQPLSFGVDDNDPMLAYRTDLGRVMKTTDGGKNWTAVYSQGTDRGYTTNGLDVTTCYGLHFDPFDSKRIFISYTDIGLFRSEDGGESWVSSTARGIPNNWLANTYWVEFDPAVKGKMWAVMSGIHDLPRFRMMRFLGPANRGGVVVSTDGGKSWAPSNKGMPEMPATHILLDPKSPQAARVLYVAGMGHGVFKSTDGGATWTAKNKGLPEKQPLTWRMAMDRNGVLYVVTIRKSEDGGLGTDRDGMLFRSMDGAESWERMSLPAGVNGPLSVTIDPEDPLRLYLSAWGRYKLYAGANPLDGGVYLSTDGGKNWAHVLDGSRRIYDVTVDPRDPNIVYACGFDSSAWRSADRGKTWQRIRGFNFKDGHRIVPDPLDRSLIYITTFGSSVWHGPAAGDPNAVEDIIAPPSMTFAAPLR